MFLEEFFRKKKGRNGLFKKKSVTESFLGEGEGLARPEIGVKYFLREGGCLIFWKNGWLDRWIAG